MFEVLLSRLHLYSQSANFVTGLFVLLKSGYWKEVELDNGSALVAISTSLPAYLAVLVNPLILFFIVGIWGIMNELTLDTDESELQKLLLHWMLGVVCLGSVFCQLIMFMKV